MIRPVLVLERLQRAVNEARGPRWRPSSYMPISKDDRSNLSGMAILRLKSLIDVATVSLVTLLFVFLFFGHPYRTEQTLLLSQSDNAPSFEMFNILGDFNASAIRNLCEHKKFQPGLYIRCDESDGGVGNIKNEILLCARYAIELGAQILVPHIHLRSTEDLTSLYGDVVNMTYLFDHDVFKQRLEDSCPGMRLYESIEEIPEEIPLLPTPDLYDPVNLHEHGGSINTHILDLRAETRSWLFGQVGVHPSKETPVLLNLDRALFAWHYAQDEYDVWYEWGKLLQFHPHIYDLAAQVLSIMAKTDSPDLWRPVIMREGYRFVGQHLRTEGDVSKEMKEYGFEPQMNAAIVTCKESNITELYIASGDAGEAAKAVKRGLEHDITVHTKYSIMEDYPALQKAIVEMTFDQQALIDWLILLKCTQFVGVDSSSFSGNLVVTRHATLPGTTPWQGFRDELSYLLGDRFEFLRDGIWP